MSWTPTSDAVEWTPPSDAAEWVPPADAAPIDLDANAPTGPIPEDPASRRRRRAAMQLSQGGKRELKPETLQTLQGLEATPEEKVAWREQAQAAFEKQRTSVQARAKEIAAGKRNAYAQAEEQARKEMGIASNVAFDSFDNWLRTTSGGKRDGGFLSEVGALGSKLIDNPVGEAIASIGRAAVGEKGTGARDFGSLRTGIRAGRADEAMGLVAAGEAERAAEARSMALQAAESRRAAGGRLTAEEKALLESDKLSEKGKQAIISVYGSLVGAVEAIKKDPLGTSAELVRTLSDPRDLAAAVALGGAGALAKAKKAGTFISRAKKTAKAVDPTLLQQGRKFIGEAIAEGAASEALHTGDVTASGTVENLALGAALAGGARGVTKGLTAGVPKIPGARRLRRKLTGPDILNEPSPEAAIPGPNMPDRVSTLPAVAGAADPGAIPGVGAPVATGAGVPFGGQLEGPAPQEFVGMDPRAKMLPGPGAPGSTVPRADIDRIRPDGVIEASGRGVFAPEPVNPLRAEAAEVIRTKAIDDAKARVAAIDADIASIKEQINSAVEANDSEAVTRLMKDHSNWRAERAIKVDEVASLESGQRLAGVVPDFDEAQAAAAKDPLNQQVRDASADLVAAQAQGRPKAEIKALEDRVRRARRVADVVEAEIEDVVAEPVATVDAPQQKPAFVRKRDASRPAVEAPQIDPKKAAAEARRAQSEARSELREFTTRMKKAASLGLDEEVLYWGQQIDKRIDAAMGEHAKVGRREIDAEVKQIVDRRKAADGKQSKPNVPDPKTVSEADLQTTKGLDEIRAATDIQAVRDLEVAYSGPAKHSKRERELRRTAFRKIRDLEESGRRADNAAQAATEAAATAARVASEPAKASPSPVAPEPPQAPSNPITAPAPTPPPKSLKIDGKEVYTFPTDAEFAEAPGSATNEFVVTFAEVGQDGNPIIGPNGTPFVSEFMRSAFKKALKPGAARGAIEMLDGILAKFSGQRAIELSLLEKREQAEMAGAMDEVQDIDLEIEAGVTGPDGLTNLDRIRDRAPMSLMERSLVDELANALSGKPPSKRKAKAEMKAAIAVLATFLANAAYASGDPAVAQAAAGAFNFADMAAIGAIMGLASPFVLPDRIVRAAKNKIKSSVKSSAGSVKNAALKALQKLGDIQSAMGTIIDDLEAFADRAKESGKPAAEKAARYLVQTVRRSVEDASLKVSERLTKIRMARIKVPTDVWLRERGMVVDVLEGKKPMEDLDPAMQAYAKASRQILDEMGQDYSALTGRTFRENYAPRIVDHDKARNVIDNARKVSDTITGEAPITRAEHGQADLKIADPSLRSVVDSMVKDLLEAFKLKGDAVLIDPEKLPSYLLMRPDDGKGGFRPPHLPDLFEARDNSAQIAAARQALGRERARATRAGTGKTDAIRQIEDHIANLEAGNSDVVVKNTTGWTEQSLRRVLEAESVRALGEMHHPDDPPEFSLSREAKGRKWQLDGSLVHRRAMPNMGTDMYVDDIEDVMQHVIERQTRGAERLKTFGREAGDDAYTPEELEAKQAAEAAGRPFRRKFDHKRQLLDALTTISESGEYDLDELGLVREDGGRLRLASSSDPAYKNSILRSVEDAMMNYLRPFTDDSKKLKFIRKWNVRGRSLAMALRVAGAPANEIQGMGGAYKQGGLSSLNAYARNRAGVASDLMAENLMNHFANAMEAPAGAWTLANRKLEQKLGKVAPAIVSDMLAAWHRKAAGIRSLDRKGAYLSAGAGDAAAHMGKTGEERAIGAFENFMATFQESNSQSDMAAAGAGYDIGINALHELKRGRKSKASEALQRIVSNDALMEAAQLINKDGDVLNAAAADRLMYLLQPFATDFRSQITGAGQALYQSKLGRDRWARETVMQMAGTPIQTMSRQLAEMRRNPKSIARHAAGTVGTGIAMTAAATAPAAAMFVTALANGALVPLIASIALANQMSKYESGQESASELEMAAFLRAFAEGDALDAMQQSAFMGMRGLSWGFGPFAAGIRTMSDVSADEKKVAGLFVPKAGEDLASLVPLPGVSIPLSMGIKAAKRYSGFPAPPRGTAWDGFKAKSFAAATALPLLNDYYGPYITNAMKGATAKGENAKSANPAAGFTKDAMIQKVQGKIMPYRADQDLRQ